MALKGDDMGLRQRIVKMIAPGMYSAEAVREVVKEEIQRVRMSLPLTANYDPHNEGYRRLSADGQLKRNLGHIDQSRMFEIAYYMFDSSAMTKGMAAMDKAFLFAEPITVTSDDEDVKEILERFWKDPDNKLDQEFPDLMMWMSLLGEQCWPVNVNPHNGHVTLEYVDPASIKEVLVNRQNVRQSVRVDLLGSTGRDGRRMAVIRQDKNGRSGTYGRLVGDCFFFAINHPPNSPRGRSDFLTLFDWIDGLERYGYNYLERAEFMLNFVWDVLLKGMTEEQIKEWLRDNPPPEPGSVRAHNENVEWGAVAPDLKAVDASKGFDMTKSFIMGAARRPDSWFGGGGKAYQTEAEQFGQVPIKDLDDRQRYAKAIATQLCQFQIDQAVIAERLSDEKAKAGFNLIFPEISKKDLTGLINGIPQLATALSIAEDKGWVSHETATKIFAMVAGQIGADINVEEELKKAKVRSENEGKEDYVD